MNATADDVGTRGRRLSCWVRIGLIGLLLAGTYAAARYYGVTEQYATAESIRALVARAGAWGVAVYLAVFTLGTLLHVPGLVFISAAVVAFGGLYGATVALLGGVLAVTVCFVVVRTLGGQALAEIDRPLIRRVMAQLQRHPYRSLIVLRAVLIVSPPLSYALALSPLSFRHYFIGSALGLVAPVLVASMVLELML